MEYRHQGYICSAPVQRVNLLFSMEGFGLGSSNKSILSALQPCCSVLSHWNGEGTCQSQKCVFFPLSVSPHISLRCLWCVQSSAIAMFCISLSTTIVATHSSTLAWKIPWIEGPDGLQSVGSQRVGHDWATLLLHVLLSSLVRGGREIFPFYILYCLWAPLCEPGATLMSRPKAENPNFWGLKKQLSSYASSVCWQWSSFQFRGIDLYVPNLFGIWDFLPKTHTHRHAHGVEPLR